MSVIMTRPNATPEEVKLNSHAAIIELASTLRDLIDDPKKLKQLSADAAASLAATADLAQQHQKTADDLATANQAKQEAANATAALEKAKKDFANEQWQAQTKFADDCKTALDKLSNREVSLSMSEADLVKRQAAWSDAQKNSYAEHKAAGEKLKIMAEAHNKKMVEFEVAAAARKNALDKREADLVAREQAVAAVKSALA